MLHIPNELLVPMLLPLITAFVFSSSCKINNLSIAYKQYAEMNCMKRWNTKKENITHSTHIVRHWFSNTFPLLWKLGSTSTPQIWETDLFSYYTLRTDDVVIDLQVTCFGDSQCYRSIINLCDLNFDLLNNPSLGKCAEQKISRHSLPLTAHPR